MTPRRWSYLTVGLWQVITDFVHSGDMAPLLEVWTPEERTRAKGELEKIKHQLARLDDALSAQS